MQPGIVTSEKLRRMKCPICGSRDKNTATVYNAPCTTTISNTNHEPVLKILACNQCGYLTMFGVAAAVIPDILFGNVKGIDEYEKLVHCQHEGNHPE